MGVTDDLPDPPIAQGKTNDRKGVVLVPFGNINSDILVKPIITTDDVGKAPEGLENGISILPNKHLVELLGRVGGGAIGGVLGKTSASGNRKKKSQKKGGPCQAHCPVIILGSSASASFSLTLWFGILSGSYMRGPFLLTFSLVNLGLVLFAETPPEAHLFSEGAVPMKGEDGKWGLRALDGNWLVPPKFSEAKGFSEQLAAVREGDLWGYLGTDGTWKIPARFSWAGDFSQGLAPACEGDRLKGKFGYIDRQGRWAISPDYDWARPFRDGLGGVKEGSKWGFVDPKGKMAVEPEFDQIGFFSSGLAPVQKSGAPGEKETWMYIRPDGSVAFDKKYAWAGNFHEGLARVQVEDRIGGKFGYIDQKGVMVIQPNFEEASDFRNGKASVRMEKKSRMIDKKGNPLD